MSHKIDRIIVYKDEIAVEMKDDRRFSFYADQIELLREALKHFDLLVWNNSNQCRIIKREGKNVTFR